MTSRTVDVRGRKVAVEEIGTGRPLLYLHGFADIHAVSATPLAFHERLGKGARLIAPAHPGVNGSDELTDGYAPSDVVFHYLELLDALGIDTCDLVGHSIGGWVAAELAVTVPDRIARLALIGACGLQVPGSHIADIFLHAQAERGFDYASLRNILFADAASKPGNRYFPDYRGETEEEVRRYQMLRFASFIGFKPPYLYDRALKGRLYRARMPSIVIWGERDNFVPRAHGEAYAAGLSGAGGRVVTIEGAGHSAPMESPDATAARVATLLKD
jgi:pimeloyl-ACP methyl ester carboxylesterase